MAAFNADIALKVQSTGAERQVKKLERSISKVEDASRDILAVDKKIGQERRKLLGLNRDAAALQRQKLKYLGQEKAELSLQKRELSAIVRLERQRLASNKRGSGSSASGGDGGGSSAAAAAGLGGFGVFAGSVVANQKKAFGLGEKVANLKGYRRDVETELNALNNDITREVNEGNAKLASLGQSLRTNGIITKNGKFLGTQDSQFRGINNRTQKIQGMQGRGKNLNTALNVNKDAIGAAESELQKLNKAAQSSGGTFGNLTKSLASAALAYVSVQQAARFATTSIQKSISAASSQQRITALSAGFDSYKLVLSRASIAAEKFNISQIEANNQFAQLYGRLRPLGLTLDEVTTVFDGFNTAAALTGATAAESAGALLQLSQALGAGALRGEEFNSIAEQAPAVLQAIGKELDVPIGQLKQLAKDGVITSDVLVAALKRVKDEGADKLAAALDTPAQKVKKLQNRFEDLQVALGKLTLPATIKLVEDLTVATEKGTGKVETYARAWDKLATALEPVTRYAGPINDFLDGLPERIATSLPGVGGLVRFLLIADKVITKLGEAPQVYGPTDEELGVGKGAGGNKPLAERLGITELDTGSSSGGGRSAADIAAEQLEQGERLAKQFSRQVGLLQAKSDIERESLQIAFDRQDREAEIAKSLQSQMASLTMASDAIAALQKLELVNEDALSKTGKYLELLKEGMEGLANDVADDFAEFNSQAKPLEETLNGIGGILKNGVVDAISLAVTETDKLGEAFQALAVDILNAVGKALMLSAITSALKGLGGNDRVGFFTMLSSGLGAREFGGPVQANAPYVVGEAGPELFIPGKSGTVVAADQFGAAKEALADETKTLTAFEVARASMERSIETRATNVTEKKEQAVETATALAEATNSSTSTVRFETYRVGEMDVVTREEAMRIGQQSAKQAEANVYRGLKNKPARRAKAGIS